MIFCRQQYIQTCCRYPILASKIPSRFIKTTSNTETDASKDPFSPKPSNSNFPSSTNKANDFFSMAPKKPPTGFMIFAGENKKEIMELGRKKKGEGNSI